MDFWCHLNIYIYIYIYIYIRQSNNYDRFRSFVHLTQKLCVTPLTKQTLSDLELRIYNEKAKLELSIKIITTPTETTYQKQTYFPISY